MRRLTSRSKSSASAAKPPSMRRTRRQGWLHNRRMLATAAIVILCAAAVSGSLFELYRSGRIDTVVLRIEDRAVSLSAQLGLVVGDIEVEGRAMTGREAILRAVGATRGTPLLAVDPAQARTQLEALPWVRSAAVERRLPDTLHIRLVERQPLAFWQRQGKLVLIDREGAVITGDRLERFPGLIVIVGDDAARRAGALLDNGIDIQLPEDDPQSAWSRLAQLEHSSRLLARDVQIVDMRLPDRLVVRVTPEPPKEPAKKGRQAAKST